LSLPATVSRKLTQQWQPQLVRLQQRCTELPRIQRTFEDV